ncbi:heterokaryon incompatibility protein [Stagonosporopsis vannaccii]|nr:heterokaryon incompatibility protein [Stagonosporopsis vannaccii]
MLDRNPIFAEVFKRKRKSSHAQKVISVINESVFDIETYLDRLQSYSSRNPTFLEDAFAVFKAFMVIHGKPMTGYMLYGMSELFFSPLLLWRPRLARRTCVEGSFTEQMPSWSWAGRIGAIQVNLAYGLGISILRPFSCLWALIKIHIHAVKFYMRNRVSEVLRPQKDIHTSHHDSQSSPVLQIMFALYRRRGLRHA